MKNNLYMNYRYSNKTSIEIKLSLPQNMQDIYPNFVYFEFSENITDFINKFDKYTVDNVAQLKSELNILFDDGFETIFIPAGRSLITLLTMQLNYIFTIMDEEQKKSIDFCTQKYIERILKIKPLLDMGICGYMNTKHLTSLDNINKKFAEKCIKIIDEILKGKYAFQSGE